MELARWRPWGLTSLQDDMNRLFGDFFPGRGRGLDLLDGKWAPPLDVAETDEEIVVKAEVPGLEPADLEISIQGDTLTISGEKKSEQEENGKSFHRVERTYGRFTRSIRLPSEVDGDKVKATYRNGVVELHLSKKEEVKKKEIKIEAE